MLTWIIENKEWFLSGLGISLIGFLVGFIKWALSKKKEGNQVTKVATNRGVMLEGSVKGNITTGDQK